MRLLYVLERYPELSQTFVEQEIAALTELGMQITVAAISPGTGADATVAVSYMERSGLLRRVTASAALAASSPAAVLTQLTREQAWPPPGGVHRIRGLLRLAPFAALAARADHVHAHFATEATDVARLLSAITRKPYSFTAHGVDSYSDQTELAVNIRGAAFARACSDHVRDRLVSAAPECHDKIHELGIAINFGLFDSPNEPPASGPIVSVGRLVEKKGFDDLIAAWATLGESTGDRELVIIGDGPLRHALESQITSLGTNVRLTGSLPNDEVAALVRAASVFALTPKTAEDGDRDGRPASIVEAMAAGLPIVSTSQPGIPGLVTSDVGFLASPGDRDQIAIALGKALVLSDEERSVMGKASREIALVGYSPSAVSRELIRLFTLSSS